jgi:hypothetical protein
MNAPLTPLMQAFLSPPARIGSWPQGLFNYGQFERESARIEERRAVLAVGEIAGMVGEIVERELAASRHARAA